MGYGLFLRHRQHILAEGVLDRLQAAAVFVEVSQIIGHEAGQPEAVIDLLDADLLAREDSGGQCQSNAN
jgi:hypothetical protein